MELTLTYRGNQNEEGGYYSASTTVEAADKDEAELKGQEFGTLIRSLIAGAYRGEALALGSSEGET